MQPLDSLEYIQTDTIAEDTVKMPGLWDNFFSMSSKLWHGDASVSSLGVSGDPIPYSLAGDDIIVIALLACTILTLIFWTRTRGFLTYQFYNILREPREDGARRRETIRQVKPMRYFALQFWFLTGFLCYAVAAMGLQMTFPVPAWATTLIFTTILFLCNVIRAAVRNIPNTVYFDIRQQRLYNTERITFLAYYGLIILPFAIYAVFFCNDIIFLGKILIFCLSIVKIIEISKVYSIFFRKNGSFVHFFLYLCTLEAVPILLTTGILTLTAQILSKTF